MHSEQNRSPKYKKTPATNLPNLGAAPVKPRVKGQAVDPAEGPMPLEAVLMGTEPEKLNAAGTV